MSNDLNETPERNYTSLYVGGLLLAILASIGGLIWSYTLSNRLAKSESALIAANKENDKLAAELKETDARLTVTSETLGKSVGMTQKQLELKAAQLMARQQSESSKFEKAQTETRTQIGAVSTEVAGVKTDVGGVKTDVAK